MNNKDNSDLPGNSKRKEKVHRTTTPRVSTKQQSSPAPDGMPLTTNRPHQNDKHQNHHKAQKQPKAAKGAPATSRDCREEIHRLSNDLSQMVRNSNLNSDNKKQKDYSKKLGNLNTPPNTSTKKAFDETQTQQIKKILAECLHNLGDNKPHSLGIRNETAFPFTLGDSALKWEASLGGSPALHKALPSMCPSGGDPMKNPTLLRSYLSESIPRREEVVSKRKNVSNSLISSDSIHHSIYLESGRERRQCLLQYLSNVAADGQVVIYVNSIPGVESLLHFLKKHGFKANAVHPRMLMAESNWILSEFSLKSFRILLCAEDHYHSCPAHFRWVKTIINFDLPICNPLENWTIRNGIVDFSDNLPVHIYTFIKKACPLDSELVKLLQLDSGDQEVVEPVPATNGQA